MDDKILERLKRLESHLTMTEDYKRFRIGMTVGILFVLAVVGVFIDHDRSLNAMQLERAKIERRCP